MGRGKRNVKTVKAKHPSLTKASFKWVICSKCHEEEVKISEESKSAICWLCCQKMVGPPPQILKKPDEDKKPRKQRGWQFMMVYVDEEGNVYHKGAEQPKLKGTLKPTPKKEYKRKTFQEKVVEEEKEAKKLLKRYNKAKVEKEKRKNGKTKIKNNKIKPKAKITNFIK